MIMTSYYTTKLGCLSIWPEVKKETKLKKMHGIYLNNLNINLGKFLSSNMFSLSQLEIYEKLLPSAPIFLLKVFYILIIS